MNIQPGSTNRRKVMKHDSSKVDGIAELCALLARVGQTALVIMVFGAFFYAYITLDNRISRTAIDMKQVNDEISKVEREITRLKNDEARYSRRDYIVYQIRKFNLPLVPANHHQTRFMTVLTAEQAARTPLIRRTYTTASNIRSRGN